MVGIMKFLSESIPASSEVPVPESNRKLELELIPESAPESELAPKSESISQRSRVGISIRLGVLVKRCYV